jgi:hypothetical protein
LVRTSKAAMGQGQSMWILTSQGNGKGRDDYPSRRRDQPPSLRPSEIPALLIGWVEAHGKVTPPKLIIPATSKCLSMLLSSSLLYTSGFISS